MEILEIETGGHSELRNVTEAVNGAVRKSGAKEGVCLVFIPHTTCAVTLNENWDPDVQKDIENFLNRAVPWENGYRHQEGNSAAHIKTLLTGSSVSVPIHGGRLFLGEWQLKLTSSLIWSATFMGDGFSWENGRAFIWQNMTAPGKEK